MDWTKISAIAIIASVFSTFLAPLFALQISSLLEKRREKRQRQFEVFQTLMQWRSTMYVEKPVQALNMIDVVFHDVKEVRDAWSELYAAYCDLRLGNSSGGASVREDKLCDLLKKMATYLGYAETFSAADFKRVYTSDALGKHYEIQLAQQNQQHELLTSKATNVAPMTRK